MRKASVLLLAVVLAHGALGCGGVDDPNGLPGCVGEAGGGTVAAQGEQFEACVALASIGDPADPGRHVLELYFSDDVVLSITLPGAAMSGDTLELGVVDDVNTDVSHATADMMDYHGFEGGPRSLCTTPPGFPPNAATSGSARVDAIERDGERLTGVDGALDATFEGCTIEALGISGAKLEVHATF